MSDEITVVESEQQPRTPEGKFAPKEAPAPTEPVAAEPEELHEDDTPVDPDPAPVDPTPVDPTEQPAEQPKKKNKTTEYIESLRTKLDASGQQIHQLMAEMAALRAAQPKPEPAKAPDPSTFYNDPIAWNQQNTQYEVQQARQQWEQQQREAQIMQGFQARAQVFAQSVPDFQQVINSVPEELLPQDLAMAIIAHERSPELAYHLGKNRGELIRLATMPPQFVSYAIEDLASRLTAPQQEAPNPVAVPPTRTVSRAPAPVTTLSGSPAVNKSYSEMSMEDYDQRRIKERREKGLR